MSQTSKSPRRVALVAWAVAKDALPAYSHRCSPKRSTQHQLFVCLVLKAFFKTDYRRIADGETRHHYVSIPTCRENRLVAVWENDGDGNFETSGQNADDLLVEYRYDGLHRRTVKLAAHTPATAPTHWDRTDYYYNSSWQCLDERYADNVATASRDNVATAVKIQRVWDIRYIDALVCRDEDNDSDGDCTDAATGIQGSNNGDEHGSCRWVLTGSSLLGRIGLGRRRRR